MLSSSYLQKSRNGVYFARFVIPAPQRSPTESRDFKLSTGTKDPRHAKSTARYLRVLFDGPERLRGEIVPVRIEGGDGPVVCGVRREPMEVT